MRVNFCYLDFIDNREIETELSAYHRDSTRLADIHIERSVFAEDNFDAERVAQVLNERYRSTAGRLSDDDDDLSKPELASVDKLFAVKCRVSIHSNFFFWNFLIKN